MKKNKDRQNKGAAFAAEEGGALSTLGEELRKKNPELMKRFDAIRETGPVFSRQTEVIHDLLPFPWDDLESFDEGIQQLIKGDYAAAGEVFEALLRETPEAYPAHHLLGHVFGCQDNFKEEVEQYRRALKIRSDYPQVYFNLGEAYWLMGREKKALAAFMRAVPLAPDFSVPDYWLSFTHERLGFDRLSGPADGARHGTRSLAYAFYLLGNAYVEHGLAAPARQAFKKAVRLWPDFAEAFFELGAIHIKKLRNPKRAEKYLETAEEIFLRNNNLQQATLAHQLGHSRGDIQDKESAAEAWLKEGLRRQGQGRYQGAIDAYKVAVSLHPLYLDAFYNMGIAYGSLADAGIPVIHKAIGALKKALSIKPDFKHAYVALGASFIKQGEIENAVEWLSKGVQIYPDEANIQYYYGVALKMSGQLDDAVQAVKRAALLKPGSVQVQFFFGLTLMDAGRPAEACEAVMEAVRLKPDFADGHHVLGVLYQGPLAEPEKATLHLRKAEKLYVKMADHRRAEQVRRLLAGQVA